MQTHWDVGRVDLALTNWGPTVIGQRTLISSASHRRIRALTTTVVLIGIVALNGVTDAAPALGSAPPMSPVTVDDTGSTTSQTAPSTEPSSTDSATATIAAAVTSSVPRPTSDMPTSGSPTATSTSVVSSQATSAPEGLTPTITTLTMAPASPDTGQRFTFTATVSPDGGTAKPTGTVTFYIQQANDQGQWSGSRIVTIDPDTGTAVLGFSGFVPGDGQVWASYEGDATFSASKSEQVNFAVPFPTVVYSPFAFPNPAVAGQPITVNVFTGWADEAAVCEGPTKLGMGYWSPDDAPGTADVNVTFTLPAGTHYITAGGSCPADPGESEVLTLVVLPAPTTVSTSPSPAVTELTTAPAAAVKTTDPPSVNTTDPHSGTSTDTAMTSTSARTSASADPTTTESTLASTGVSLGPSITVGLTAFAFGALLLLIGRRRARTNHGH
jgi:hypothetical protein